MNPLFEQLVDMRRLDDGVPQHAQAIRSQIVGEQENDVGPGCRLRCIGGVDCGQRRRQQSCGKCYESVSCRLVHGEVPSNGICRPRVHVTAPERLRRFQNTARTIPSNSLPDIDVVLLGSRYSAGRTQGFRQANQV